MIVDALATLASVLKIPIYPNRKYEIEFKHRLIVPDNVKYWQVFKDDKQLHNFFQISKEFSSLCIDEEKNFDEDEQRAFGLDSDGFENQVSDLEVIQLKNNVIPKYLVPLEKLFYQMM